MDTAFTGLTYDTTALVAPTLTNPETGHGVSCGGTRRIAGPALHHRPP